MAVKDVVLKGKTSIPFMVTKGLGDYTATKPFVEPKPRALVDVAADFGLQSIFNVSSVLAVHSREGVQTSVSVVLWPVDQETLDAELVSINSQKTHIMMRRSQLKSFPPQRGETFVLTDTGMTFEVVADDLSRRTYIPVDRLERFVKIHAQRVFDE